MSGIDDEDKKQFRAAMQHVKKLHDKQNRVSPKSKKTMPKQRRLLVEEDTLTHPLPSQAESIAPETALFFARSGLQQSVLKRLKAGKLPSERVLNLRHKTIQAAEQALNRCFNQCAQANIRTIRIIHGKGYRTPDGAISIKSLLNRWLREHEQVLGFASCIPQQGGTGAVTVLLKASSRT